MEADMPRVPRVEDRPYPTRFAVVFFFSILECSFPSHGDPTKHQMVGGVNLNEHPLVPQKPVTAAFSKESLDVFLNSSRKSRFAPWDGEMHDAKLKQFTQQE